MYMYTNTLPNSLLCRRAHFVLSCLQMPSPLWHWKMIQKKNSLIFFPAQSNSCTVLLDRIHVLVHLLSQDSNNLFLSTTPSEQGSQEISLCLRAHSNFKFPLSSQGADDLKFHVFSLLLLDPACSIQRDTLSFCHLITTQPILYSSTLQYLNTMYSLASCCTLQTISIYLNMKWRFYPYNTVQTRYLMYYSFFGRETTGTLLAGKKYGYIIIRYKIFLLCNHFVCYFPCSKAS